MIMRHYVFERDAVFFHQHSRELCRPLQRRRAAGTTVLAHFDADRVSVARAIEVRVFALLRGWQVLDGDLVIYCEMPDQIADAITAATLRCTQGTAFQRQ